MGAFETGFRDCTCGELRGGDKGREVKLCGWVGRRRDHGGLIFLDLRDRYGITQIVVDPSLECGAGSKARAIRLEYVIQVEGEVRERPDGMVNSTMKTGEIEVLARSVKLLSRSSPTPFQIEGPIEASEDIRLAYRYLDLRREDLQRNLELKSRLMQVARGLLVSKGFIEIETPILTRRTPEGARDYLVPSRIHPGKFYAMPQSPQLYKQLLMFAGMDRYFQLARCFRDEDLRADRQPEFTQIDIEMSFVDEEDVLALTEDLFCELYRRLMDVEIARPFRRITYAEAMERYGTDRPDMRFSMEVVDFSRCFTGTAFRVFRSAIESGGRIRGLVVKGGGKASRRELEEYEACARKGGARGLVWLRSKEGEWSSSAGSHLCEDELRSAYETAKARSDGDLILLVAGPDRITSPALDELRRFVGGRMKLLDMDRLEFTWIVDPPLFEITGEDGSMGSVHHPFTSPREDDLEALDTEPLAARARAYDIVLNGVELGGGSIRISDREVQEVVFRALGLGEGEYREQFGFMLEALNYGVPPHGGIALGLDRIAMMVAGAASLREVVAFPKTTTAQGLMEGSPSFVGDEELRELHIKKLDNGEDLS
jgi:aspartyl-tRNA synthetase